MDLTADYWENRWQTGDTGWDLGSVSPPLVDYTNQIPADKRNLRVLIPGCGNGYEAVHLLHSGFTNLTMVDFAPTAVRHLEEYLNKLAPGWPASLQLVCGDFFDLTGPFDLILEQTFFCALDPALREAYTRKMAELLAPGGKLVGVLYDKDFVGGPPFGGHAHAYRRLFQPFFRIKTLAPCHNSIPPRAGAEVFMILER